MDYGLEAPSLVKLCIQTAIDNIRYISDVGETDMDLLKEILPHCTVEQLAHIEMSTEGRDLSSVTDSLWKRFYGQAFGPESVDVVIKRMKQKSVRFKWRLLYEAKCKEREEAQKKAGEQLKQRYAEEQKKKQSRQIRVVDKKPPASNRRVFSGGSYGLSNVKSNIMKKAKIEYLNSHEAKVHASMRKNALQRANHSLSRTNIHGKDSASSSRPGNPSRRL